MKCEFSDCRCATFSRSSIFEGKIPLHSGFLGSPAALVRFHAIRIIIRYSPRKPPRTFVYSLVIWIRLILAVCRDGLSRFSMFGKWSCDRSPVAHFRVGELVEESAQFLERVKFSVFLLKHWHLVEDWQTLLNNQISIPLSFASIWLIATTLSATICGCHMRKALTIRTIIVRLCK